MRYRIITLIVLAAIVILLSWFSIFLRPISARAIYQQGLVTSASPTASSLPRSASTGIPQVAGSNNIAIPVALIGAIGAILAALIAAGAALGVAMYQTRHNTQSDGTKKTSKHKKTVERSVLTYRDFLRTDPRIFSLQILDMSRPMAITNIYVSLWLHREARLGYEIDPDLLASEARRDPNALLQVGRISLESRASKAIDPNKAISTYKHCIILGDPGAGKTTLLKYLALKSVARQLPGLPDLPIHIELNAFASSGYHDLLDFASTKWNELYGIPIDKARKYMEENLDAGKALLLLDALDETVIGATANFAEDSYRRVTETITQIATHYPQAPIVITARKAGYQQRVPLSGFTELEVLDFRSQDIRQFIYKWFANYPGPQKRDKAADLIARLERNPRIQALAANPLLLSLIVIVYEAQLDLPDRRAELYRQCVETLLTKWDASRDIRRRREFKPEHKRQLLEEVAWHFHLQGRRYFPEDELLTVIAGFLPAVGLKEEQNRQILGEIAAEIGLLKEQARGWHGFLHLTLQEYFVALYVLDHNKLDTLLIHRGDPWWEEVILLYAGQSPDASPLLQRLLGLSNENSLQEDIFQTNLILAGRSLAARPTVRQVALREEITSRLFNLLANTPYLLTGQQIVDVLFEIGGSKVHMRLLSLISDQQINTKLLQRITVKLDNTDEHSLVSELVPLLSNQQIDPAVRKSIAGALGELGDESLVSELVPLLFNQQIDPAVRQGIAGALGELSESSVVAADLLKLLFDPQLELLVSAALAMSLGKIGGRSVAPDLLKLLSDPQLDPFVRGGFTWAREETGERSVALDLLKLLSDQQLDPFVRGCIADALGKIGKRSVAPDLLKLLSDPQLDPFVRGYILYALGKIGERSVAPDLLKLLSDPQLELMLQKGWVDVLGNLDEHPRGKEVLLVFSDWLAEQGFRVDIAEELGRLGEKSVVPDLLQLLSNPQLHTDVRRSIAHTLGELGDQSVVPDLLKLLSVSQLELKVCEGIANALGQIVDDEVTVHALAVLLEKPDIADYVHQALWTTSRRAGVRVFTIDGPTGKQPEIVKWENEPKLKDSV